MHEWACYCDEAANPPLPTAAAFWVIWIVSIEECSSLTQIWCRFIALLCHFERDGHAVHVLTQGHLPSLPLTSTVKSSLSTQADSSPLSLAARLHRCHTNHSHYINNGWTFSGQTLPPSRFLSIYMCVYRYVCMHIYVCICIRNIMQP